MSAPNRYCLAVCYCGACEHYTSAPDVKAPPIKPRKTTKPDTWTTREDATWIDQL